MRIGIPIWCDDVSPALDFSRRILVVETVGSMVLSRFSHDFEGRSDQARVERLLELGVDVLICGAVSNALARRVMASGILLIPWKRGAAEEALAAYVDGSIEEPRFRMPGCR